MPDSIGVDVGGTKILAGRVREDGQVAARRQVPTEHGSGLRILRQIADLVADLAGGDDLDGIGVGFPGTIDQRRGVVVQTSNLPMADVHALEELQRETGHARVDRQRRQLRRARRAPSRRGSGPRALA